MVLRRGFLTALYVAAYTAGRGWVEALRDDHEFLLRGDVFTPDVIDTWIWYKMTPEVEALRVRPHPYEFTRYYDV